MTTATINNYMTKFIEVLAEKYGYVAEVMQNEWQSLNTQWMVAETEEKPVVKKTNKRKARCTNTKVKFHEFTTKAPKKTAEDNEEEVAVVKCVVLLKTGANKGKECGKKALDGTETCKMHTPKDDYEPAAKKPVEKKVAEKCCFILEAGKNKGTRCTKNAVAGLDMCKPHASKSTTTSSDEEEKPVEKVTEEDIEAAIEKIAKDIEELAKEIESETEEVSETVDTEESSTESEKEEIALEEFAKEIESSSDDEETPSTKIAHCDHTFKYGKNKGEKCTAEPVDGSDKCKKHTK
jgi:hypothetical protein